MLDPKKYAWVTWKNRGVANDSIRVRYFNSPQGSPVRKVVGRFDLKVAVEWISNLEFDTRGHMIERELPRDVIESLGLSLSNIGNYEEANGGNQFSREKGGARATMEIGHAVRLGSRCFEFLEKVVPTSLLTAGTKL